MEGDGLRDDRIPAFLIELDALLKSGEKEVPSGEVLVDFLVNSVLFFELICSWIVAGKFEVGCLYFAESGGIEDVIVETDNFILRDLS
jgi:hypothetical protein